MCDSGAPSISILAGEGAYLQVVPGSLSCDDQLKHAHTSAALSWIIPQDNNKLVMRCHCCHTKHYNVQYVQMLRYQ